MAQRFQLLYLKNLKYSKIRLETNPQEQPTKDKPQLIADNIINSLINYKEKITEIGIATTGSFIRVIGQF